MVSGQKLPVQEDSVHAFIVRRLRVIICKHLRCGQTLAFRSHGVRGIPGDCFTEELAREKREPVLRKGEGLGIRICGGFKAALVYTQYPPSINEFKHEVRGEANQSLHDVNMKTFDRVEDPLSF